MVYVLLGLVDEAERQRQVAQQSRAGERRQQAQDLAHQQELQRLRQQQRHELRLRQLELEHEAHRASREPAPERPESQHEPVQCQGCWRSFGSVQALNAHRRFCPQQTADNGR